MTREEALMELLSRPDEPCLAGLRVHRQTLPGDQDPDIVKRNLGRAYLLQRWQEHKDISTVVGKRQQQSLRIVRRA